MIPVNRKIDRGHIEGADYLFQEIRASVYLAFDWRPGFRLTNESKWKSDNWGIIVRYRFNKGAKLVPTN